MSNLIVPVIAFVVALFAGFFAYLNGRKTGKQAAENSNLKVDNEVMQEEVKRIEKANAIEAGNSGLDDTINQLRDLAKD